MHPVLRKRPAAGALALRDFVFVMRKLQIGTAAVDVERLAQQRAAHGRALDVPARPACAIGTGPLGLGGLLGLGAFPEHEIERILFAVEHGHALAGTQFVERLAAELAVAVELANGVIDVAAGHPVGQALLLETVDEAQHLRHVVGGTRLVRGAFDAEGIGILVQGVDHAVRQGTDALAVVQRPPDDLVVDVGDVTHIGDAVARGPEPALDDVEGHHRTRMAEVTQVIHRHAAHVHAHVAGVDRGKRRHPTRERVVDAECHDRKNWGTAVRAMRRSQPRVAAACAPQPADRRAGGKV